MGSCISSSYSEANSNSITTPTAKVISTKGDLHEFSIPVTASQVLRSETDSPLSFFICNSDKLYYDDYIPPLDSTHLLQPDQIYFVLPIARLNYPLTTSDMAALAVKANAALLHDSSKKTSRCRRRKIRVSPVADVDPPRGGGGGGDSRFVEFKRFEKGGGGGGGGGMGLLRSGSVRKLQRKASTRAKIVYKSFKMRLTTIYENEGYVPAQ